MTCQIMSVGGGCGVVFAMGCSLFWEEKTIPLGGGFLHFSTFFDILRTQKSDLSPKIYVRST